MVALGEVEKDSAEIDCVASCFVADDSGRPGVKGVRCRAPGGVRAEEYSFIV